MTIEVLDDAVNGDLTHVILRNDASTSLSGTFEAKLNDNDWTTISWEHVSHGIDYNLVQACDPDKETIHYGEKLQIRGLDKWNDSSSGYRKLKVISDSGAKVSGKLADSLTPEFAASATYYKLMAFFQESTGLKDASGLDLDGIALANGCYQSMFSGCTSLTAAPEIPATKLEYFCYSGMFRGCTSLTAAPTLPATALANSCYSYMFASCTSLVSAPALPATALATYCYSYMFYGCAGLATQDINLPATTLAGDCYNGMFDNCGTASTKTVHIPTSLASEVTANTFGSNTGVTVAYDL